MQQEQMQESRYDEEGGWPESTSTGPKRKASELRRAASANVTGKKKSVASKRQGTISIDNVGSGPASKAREPVQPASLPPALQDQRDLEEQLVELDHLRTLNIEVDRERGVTQKVQGDVEMLRKQLARRRRAQQESGASAGRAGRDHCKTGKGACGAVRPHYQT